jgi:hypothetical protein
MTQMPRSISPASVPVAPMPQTPLQPESVMLSARHTQNEIVNLGFTQLTGSAQYVAASPDGSIWVVSNQYYAPSGNLIWHYVNGTWTNLPGVATRLAVAPDNSLWAINATGGIFHYVAGGTWTTIGGGASDISVGADGTLYAISNTFGYTYGYGIFHLVNGTWTQLGGAGVRIAASWDPGTYPNVSPGGFYVVDKTGRIFYFNPPTGYEQVGGTAVQVAPATSGGGLFALGGTPGTPGLLPIDYNNLNTGTWDAMPGAATSIATNGASVYVVGGGGGIYASPITPGIYVPPPTPNPLVGTGAPLTGPSYGPSTAGSPWGPTAVANALKFPVQSGFNGTGITIAVVNASSISAADLATYLGYFQITQTNPVSVELLQGASPTPTAANITEASLDVETIAGLAPGAKIVLYVEPSLTTASFNDALAQIQQDGQASIISYSVGGCENSGTTPSTSSLIANLSSTVTVVAAAGDSGSACFSSTNASGQSLYLTGVGYPASDPNAIGVGGTETGNTSGTTTLASTAVWNDTLTTSGQQEASGGGVSSLFAIPSFQVGLSGTASAQYRNVPDISMPAVYAATYFNAKWQVINGTSWGTPQFAAMLAEIYQYCGRTSFGTAVALPYTAFSRANYTSFIDVLTGNNAFSLTGGNTPAYAAQAGYDNASGIGVPFGMPMANALCPNRVPSVASRANALAQFVPPVHSQAYRVDVRPKAVGLSDLGRRAPGGTTGIQLVISSAGSPANNEQSAIESLRSAGFAIAKTYTNHLVVDATGPSAAVEALFSTEMRDVAQPHAGNAYMPAGPITIPASLAPYVVGVVLDSVVTFH